MQKDGIKRSDKEEHSYNTSMKDKLKTWIHFLEIATVTFLILHIGFQLVNGMFEGLTSVHWCTIAVIAINRFNMWFPQWLDDFKNDGHD